MDEVIEDPFGHRWVDGNHVRDVAPADMQKAMQSHVQAGTLAQRPWLGSHLVRRPPARSQTRQLGT